METLKREYDEQELEEDFEVGKQAAAESKEASAPLTPYLEVSSSLRFPSSV